MLLSLILNSVALAVCVTAGVRFASAESWMLAGVMLALAGANLGCLIFNTIKAARA